MLRVTNGRLESAGTAPSRTLWLGFALAGAALLSAFGGSLAAEIWALRGLAAGPSPWFVAAHAGLLYLLFPLVTLASSLLLFAPGLLLALRLDGGRGDFGAVLLHGFFLSIVGQSVALGFADAVAGVPLQGQGFVAFLALLTAAALVPIWLADRRDAIAWEMFRARRFDIAAMAGAPAAVLLLLTAKFYWEALNGDGAHLFLSGQNLIHRGSPFWDGSAGGLAAYPSITTLIEVIPNAWIQRLFGPFELSARLPVLPGLALMAGLVLDLIRYGRTDLAERAAALGVGAALVLYAWVLAWHASYDPYFADIALPMSREPYVMIAFLGFMRFALDRNVGWTMVFAALSYAALPSAPIFLMLWVLAVAMTQRPVAWRWLVAAIVIILAVVIAGRVLPSVLSAIGVGSERDEFNADNLAERLRYVTPFRPQRMLFWILPCGILPALVLAAWRWQDPVARAVSLLTAGYMMFFYLQGYRVLPHHFAPGMVLPLIVFWRLSPVRARPGRALGLALAGLAVAAVLSLPGGYRPHLYGRDFGARIAIEGATGGIADDPALLAVSNELLAEAFPMLWGEDAAQSHYLGSPLAWFVHARQPKTPGQEIAYRIAPATEAPLPEGQIVVATRGGYVLTASNAEVYAADVARGGWQRTIGPLYYIKRNAIFGSGSRGWPRPIVDLFEIEQAIGLKGMTQ